MKVKTITKELMENWYEKDGWLYWKIRNGRRGLKDSLAGTLDKNNGYYRVGINKCYYHNHRILYQFYHNIILKETDLIDHINGIKTDNRKENLRLCNNSENQCNKNVQKINKSTGIKNISIMKANILNYQYYDYYHIQIRKNGKEVFSKICRTDKFTLEDVIKIRDEQLKIHHGEFCNLN